MSAYTKEQVSYLVEGKLDWDTTLRMLQMPKDQDRFRLYLEVLQAKVPWDDRIVLPLGPHLYIAQAKQTKRWVTKCECGHELGDYRENWKLNAVVFVRDTEEAMSQVYPKLMAPGHAVAGVPGVLLPVVRDHDDVEAPTPWYPVIHDFEPNIESFYQDSGEPAASRARRLIRWGRALGARPRETHRPGRSYRCTRSSLRPRTRSAALYSTGCPSQRAGSACAAFRRG